MATMLMAKTNKVSIGRRSCCDWDDTSRVPCNRVRMKRAYKRRERQQWRKEVAAS